MVALFVVVVVSMPPVSILVKSFFNFAISVSLSSFVLFNCNLKLLDFFHQVVHGLVRTYTRAYADNAIAATMAMAKRERITTKPMHLALMLVSFSFLIEVELFDSLKSLSLSSTVISGMLGSCIHPRSLHHPRRKGFCPLKIAPLRGCINFHCADFILIVHYRCNVMTELVVVYIPQTLDGVSCA